VPTAAVARGRLLVSFFGFVNGSNLWILIVIGPIFAPLHFLNHQFRDLSHLARSQKGCNLSARLDPNSLLLREYSRNGETGIFAGQLKLDGCVCDDPLNLLVL
jgi:hypothetical protein